MLAGAAVAIGLPTLEAFLNTSGTALASGNPLPKRFGIFFWGNGILPDRWVPAATGTDYVLSPQLTPLAQLQPYLTVVSGMKVYTGNTVPHGSGPAGLLSGAPLLTNDDTDTFADATIDQLIASAIGGDTRFRSLEVGVENSTKSMSFNGPHSNNPPECSPRAFFDRLFGADFVAPGATPKLDPKLALRRSVLDAVADDATRLRDRLGAADKIRLEQHLDGVRSLELRLQKLEENPPNLASCKAPAQPLDSYPDLDGRPDMSAISRAMADTLAMALACDQTRVFSDWFSRPVDNILYPGATAGHHQLTHDEPTPQPQVDAIVTSIIGEFAYLLGALHAVPEGDGTLLDNCLVLGTTDCSYGKAHSIEDYPILLAGSAGGAIKNGLHYRSVASENTSKVMLTVARAMGLNLAEFGKEGGHVTEGLSAIEAG
jgi:hypothetical protein